MMMVAVHSVWQTCEHSSSRDLSMQFGRFGVWVKMLSELKYK